MSKHIRYARRLLLIITCSANLCFAASSAPAGYTGGQWWVSAGLGAAGGSALGGGTALIEGNYRLSEHQLITVRTSQTTDFQIFSSGDEFTEAGVLYGYIAKAQYGYASASAGLGWAQYKRYYNQPGIFSGLFGGPVVDNEYTKRQNTVNIPLEIQLFTTPTPYFGIGIIGFSNINSANVVSGAVLALQFGNLW